MNPNEQRDEVDVLFTNKRMEISIKRVVKPTDDPKNFEHIHITEKFGGDFANHISTDVAMLAALKKVAKHVLFQEMSIRKSQGLMGLFELKEEDLKSK